MARGKNPESASCPSATFMNFSIGAVGTMREGSFIILYRRPTALGFSPAGPAQSGPYLPQSSTNDETLVLKVASAKSWEHFTENRGNFPARMMRSGKIPQ